MKAAAYARYSTDNQTQNSIAYQMAAIQKYASEKGISLIHEYHDDAESGTDTVGRGDFNSMVEAAIRGDFDTIIVYDITRGSRDVGDWFLFRKQMRAAGVTVLSVKDDLGDVLDPNNFLRELLGVGLGQHQVLSSRQKSIDGKAVKAVQGVFLGGIPPYGYDVKDQRYVINESEAAVIRKIFSMYIDGASYNKILDAIGPVCGKRGRPLGKNSLPSILQNERYAGIYLYNEKVRRVMHKWAGAKPNPKCVRLDGVIPPIIDQATWKKACERKRNVSIKGENKAKRSYLLSGLIQCERCGATYVGHCSISRGIESRYYICGSKYRTRTCPDSKNHNADALEKFVVDNLKNYLMSIDFSEEAESIAKMFNSASADLENEKRDLADTKRKIANGVKALMEGLDIPELKLEIDRMRKHQEGLEDIIARNSVRSHEMNPKDVEELLQTALKNLDDPARLRSAIRLMVEKIYALADGSVAVHVGVHVSGSSGRV